MSERAELNTRHHQVHCAVHQPLVNGKLQACTCAAASPTAQPDGAIAAAPQGYAVSEDVNLACLDECLNIVGHAVDETYSPKVMGLMLGALALLGAAKEEYLRPTAAARSLAGERTNA